MAASIKKKEPVRQSIAELREGGEGKALNVWVASERLDAFRTAAKAKGVRMIDAVADAIDSWMQVNG